jgi:dihydroorotase
VFMNESMAETVISREDALRRIFVNCRKISVHAEGEKVAQAINLVKETKSRLYLCHLSSAQDVAHLKKYLKAKVFGEVSPHHLFLTADDDKDCFTKMKPTLKTKSDQAALWKAMEQGLIDTVGSDHAPHTIEEKGQDNFPYGVPGVETTLPLLLNAVNNKRLTLNKLVELCCENPAKIFGIADKGFIRPGYDADLVIVDMNLEKEVRNQELLTRCKWSPFNGWKLRGWPVTTIVKGKAVFDKGKTTNDTGKEVKFYF